MGSFCGVLHICDHLSRVQVRKGCDILPGVLLLPRLHGFRVGSSQRRGFFCCRPLPNLQARLLRFSDGRPCKPSPGWWVGRSPQHNPPTPQRRLGFGGLSYYVNPCPNCGRVRVLCDAYEDGICEKCEWDVFGGDYAAVTRPALYDGVTPVRQEVAERRRSGLPDEDA